MMRWYLTTPEGKEFEVDISDWSATWFYEPGTPRPSEAALSVPRDTPALEKQWVRAEEDCQTKLIGYISRHPSISGAVKELEIKGCEDLLWSRPCPKITYSASDTTLNHLFADKQPWVWPDPLATYQVAGLLNSANSYMLPGWRAPELPTPAPMTDEPGVCAGPRLMENQPNGIIKFRFCGKKSRLGTSDIYHDCNKFPEFNSLASLTASAAPGIYRDDIDLYIYIPQDVVQGIDSIGFGWVYGNFFAYNAFDTKVRRGVIDLADTVISDPIRVGPDSLIGDICANIAYVHKQKIRFRYENDNFCHMDVKANFDDEEIVDIYEEDCSDIKFSSDSDIHPDALIGLGQGDSLLKSAYSVFDTRPGKAFIIKTEDFDNSFEDAYGNLAPYTDAKWSELRNKKIIQVYSNAYNHVVPGNSVRLHLNGEPDQIYQVASIARSATKTSVISLGRRAKDLIDAYKARRSASDTYLIDDMIDLESTSFDGVIGVGDWNNADVPFDTDLIYLPSMADYADYNPASLLEITISLRENCFQPVDLSSHFWVCMASSKTALDASRVANSETIQYLIGDTITVKPGPTAFYSNNYIRVHCKLNGGWPAGDRTLAQIVAGINTDPAGTHNRDDYVKGVWGRHLNEDYYALLVKLESDLYAYQIMHTTASDWAIGDADAVAKAIYYSFVSESGRSKAIVLAEILTPSPAKDRDDYVKGVWGKNSGSGSWMLVIKVDATPTFAYQMHTTGNANSVPPWYFGTLAQAAAAFYAAISSEEGTRVEADILADLNGYTYQDPATTEYHVHGYEAASYPIAHIIELSDAADDKLRLAYRIETASATFTSWKTDEKDGESIIEALLEDNVGDSLRKQSDIRTDISNLVFAEPETYSWQAYGYEIPATPSFTVIQVENSPQVLAYKRKWVDGEEGDWAIDKTSGAGIASQIMLVIPYFNISVNAKIVRRRLLP